MAGEAHVTIAPMIRALVLGAAVLLTLSACGDDGGGSRDAAAEAAQTAEEALEATEELTGDVADLQEELDEGLADAGAADDRVDRRLKAISQRLSNALADVRSSIESVRATADGASGDVASALSRAEAAARDLAVLESRFDYHLKNGH